MPFTQKTDRISFGLSADTMFQCDKHYRFALTEASTNLDWIIVLCLRKKTHTVYGKVSSYISSSGIKEPIFDAMKQNRQRIYKEKYIDTWICNYVQCSTLTKQLCWCVKVKSFDKFAMKLKTFATDCADKSDWYVAFVFISHLQLDRSKKISFEMIYLQSTCLGKW